MDNLLNPVTVAGYNIYIGSFLVQWLFSILFTSACALTGLEICGYGGIPPSRTYYAAVAFAYFQFLATLFILGVLRHYRRLVVLVILSGALWWFSPLQYVVEAWKSEFNIVGLLFALVHHIPMIFLTRAGDRVLAIVMDLPPGHWLVQMLLVGLVGAFDSTAFFWSSDPSTSPHFANYTRNLSIVASLWLSLPFLHLGAVELALEVRHNNNVTSLQDVPNPNGGFYDSRLKTSYAKSKGLPVITKDPANV